MSALAAQLRLLSSGAAPPQHAGRPSLLFDSAQAADTDISAIYQLGLSGAQPRRGLCASSPQLPAADGCHVRRAGFAELCRADSRFEAFSKSLFAKAGAEFNRELQARAASAPPVSGGWGATGLLTSAASTLLGAQDAEANERLDTALEAFLRLLSAYFLLPASTRALEYLVRRYKCVRRACRARNLPQ